MTSCRAVFSSDYRYDIAVLDTKLALNSVAVLQKVEVEKS